MDICAIQHDRVVGRTSQRIGTLINIMLLYIKCIVLPKSISCTSFKGAMASAIGSRGLATFSLPSCSAIVSLGPNPLAKMDPPGPNPLADMDPGGSTFAIRFEPPSRVWYPL